MTAWERRHSGPDGDALPAHRIPGLATKWAPSRLGARAGTYDHASPRGLRETGTPVRRAGVHAHWGLSPRQAPRALVGDRRCFSTALRAERGLSSGALPGRCPSAHTCTAALPWPPAAPHLSGGFLQSLLVPLANCSPAPSSDCQAVLCGGSRRPGPPMREQRWGRERRQPCHFQELTSRPGLSSLKHQVWE